MHPHDEPPSEVERSNHAEENLKDFLGCGVSLISFATGWFIISFLIDKFSDLMEWRRERKLKSDPDGERS